MKVYVSQIYPHVDARYPFSHIFQRYVSDKLTEYLERSEQLAKEGIEIVTFQMSAKRGIDSAEVYGPGIYKEDKEIEYTIFIPFRGNTDSPGALAEALKHLFSEIIRISKKLGIGTGTLEKQYPKMIQEILSDKTMFRELR